MKNFLLMLLFCIPEMLVYCGCTEDVGNMEELSSDVISGNEFEIHKARAMNSYSGLDYFLANNVTDSILSNIIASYGRGMAKDSAKMEDISRFMVENGWPLWEEYFFTTTNEGFLYIIPVVKDGSNVECLWFFEKNLEGLFAYYKRKGSETYANEEIDWMYDYMTYRLYHKKNSKYAKIEIAKVRITHCNDIYTGWIDSDGVEHVEYSYTYCWESGGGLDDLGFEDEGEGGKEPIDYEVEPPEGGGSTIPPFDFKDINNIKSDSIVVARMRDAVAKMKNNLKVGRKEYGFWIFYDSRTKMYYIGKVLESEVIAEGKEGAKIKFNSNSPEEHKAPATSIPVAFFHVHTALTYDTGFLQRKVGFSKGDIDVANIYECPFLLYDYIGEEQSGIYIIESGHTMNAPMKLYEYIP